MFDWFKTRIAAVGGPPSGGDPAPTDPFGGKPHKWGEPVPRKKNDPDPEPTGPWWQRAGNAAGRTATGAWKGTTDDWWKTSGSGFVGGAIHGTDDDWWK